MMKPVADIKTVNVMRTLNNQTNKQIQIDLARRILIRMYAYNFDIPNIKWEERGCQTHAKPRYGIGCEDD